MTPADTLRKYWGYDSFRPLQEDIVRSVLDGHDTLGLMPTGGGKSITFQVPGLIMGGLTVVVTPLISLMKDQVDNLRRRGIKAVYFHSGMTAPEVRQAWERLVNAKSRFLYVAPERLRNERFVTELLHLDVRLIVVDEAHCISQWGYDFRPSYLNIRTLRRAIPKAPVLALTATATPDVADDIRARLEFRQGHNTFRKSFSRDNISYIVRRCDTKIHDVFHILSRTSGSSIVYVRSRKRTREIAEYLESAGISATFYHAGLDFDVKSERQNAWQAGAVRVMVATNAFGMGIDKPDVRVVVHYDIPPSLEEYYQEAGRAGRDGLESYAVLLVSKNDPGVMRRRVTQAFPEREYILMVYERVCNFLNVAVGEGYEFIREFDVLKFCETFSLAERQCRSALRILSRAGYLDFVEETESRSRVMILVSREELYSVGRVSLNADKVLNALLRNYPGLFMEYVYISENLIGRETMLDHEAVYDAMLELKRMKVLSYVPKSRLPVMHFPTSRELPRYVLIGRAVYEDRREDMSRRTESMLNYAFDSSDCRVERMLAYFGETDARRCGKCDVCRDRRVKKKIASAGCCGEGNKSIQSPRLNPELIIRLLSEHPYGATVALMGKFVADEGVKASPAEVAAMLDFLAGEGFISVKGDIFFSC